MKGKSVTISTITLFRQHKTNWRKTNKNTKSKMQILCYTHRQQSSIFCILYLLVNSPDFGGKRLTNEWMHERTLIESPHLKFKWTSTDAFKSNLFLVVEYFRIPYYPVFTYDVGNVRVCTLFLSCMRHMKAILLNYNGIMVKRLKKRLRRMWIVAVTELKMVYGKRWRGKP